MIRAAHTVMLFSLLAASSGFCADLYSEKDKLDLYSGAFSGCMDKQQGLREILKDSAVEVFCKCVADDITNSLLGDIDFQVAISRRQSHVLKSMAESQSSQRNAELRLKTCMGKTASDLGGVNNLIRGGLTESEIKKKGLKGELRAAFINSGAQRCSQKTYEERGYEKKKAEDYCICIMGKVADQISAFEMLELVKANDSEKQMKEIVERTPKDICLRKLR